MAAETPLPPNVSADLSPVKRALAEIRELRARLERVERERREPIAIVGMGCRFPGASSPDEFWSLISEGRDAIREVPHDRWDVERYFDADPDAPGKMYTRWGGFLENVDRFDARFFGITPREAVRMDPQHRLLLEVAWESLEHAGLAADRLFGQPVGVFIGLATTDYLQLQLRGDDPSEIDAYIASGGAPAVASGRLSYLLGFRGPSVTIDTACSSSLVAVHLACQSLRAQECRAALAGGVNLVLLPEMSINFSRARMMAADGRCKTFDATADGYVRSEGCGVLVLKRLSDAQADGDRVLAVVRGTAVNQDGRSSGLTVPNGPAQEAVLREALARADLQPADVGYIEAHGTGTSLGDPIEVRALANVFCEERPASRPLVVGSVKTNIGHLEAAAGVAGIIKAALCMAHGQIPKHLHFSTPNPLIEWERLPIRVPQTLESWREEIRRAGVSSFGFSGTNAHVILEQAPAAPPASPPPPDCPPHVLPLSAKSPEALAALAARMADHLSRDPSPPFPDVCFTAATGRSNFAHRLAVVADTSEAASASLSALAAGRPGAVVTGVHVDAVPAPVAFLFTGQGAQYSRMAHGLYETQPVFRQSLDRCAEILRPHMDRPLLDVMFGQASALIDQTMYTQPALFALEFSLVALWRSWGVVPSIVMGHSLGEDVAACVAGVFSVEDGLALIARRGQLMQALPPDGEMVSIFTSEETVRLAIASYGSSVAVAAINGPGVVTVSGERTHVREVVALCERDGIKTRPLSASHAFHSPLMDPMLEPYEQAVRRVDLRSPTIPLVSNVTGAIATDADVRSAEYWRRHVREPVRFEAAMKTVWDRGVRVCVEIGPHPVLLGLAQRLADAGGVFLASLRRGRDDNREISSSLAGLYVAGATVDWDACHAAYGRRRVALPTYPFQGERFWSAPAAKAAEPRSSDSSWSRAADAAAQQADSAPLDLLLPSYPAKWARLDELSVAFVILALQRLELFNTVGERHDIDSLVARFAIEPMYAGVLRRWLEALVVRGHLRQEGDEFVADRRLTGPAPESLASDSSALFAEFRAPLDYVVRSGRQLVELLTGRESPLEMLFPDGSTELADGLYSHSPQARYANGIVRAAVTAAAVQADPRRPVRILEIGGGTGGTTAGLLSTLSPSATQYCFTDVGPLFLTKARSRFAAYPFVTYRTLDIERVPEQQGFNPGECDVIVAANVLHATKDLHQTLDHVAWLLAPGGTLVLYETTEHPFWFDVTMALITGWQRFDDDLRVDVPVLSPDGWRRALQRHGFEPVLQYPQSGSPAEVLRQHIFLARAPQHSQVPVSHGRSVFTEVVEERREPIARVASGGTTTRDELASLPESERYDRLAGLVRDTVVEVLRLDAARPPDRGQRLMEFGIDSLMSVEFRNVLTSRLGLDRKLPATLIFDHPTVDAIARHIMASGLVGNGRPVDGALTDSALHTDRMSLEAVEEMSETEIEALLSKRLETL